MRGMTTASRLALAEVLAARPATRAQGIARLENGFDGDFGLQAYLALLLGRAYEAAGDKERAIKAYSRFARLWDKPSPRAEPMLAEATRALKQLTGEGQPLGR